MRLDSTFITAHPDRRSFMTRLGPSSLDAVRLIDTGAAPARAPGNRDDKVMSCREGDGGARWGCARVANSLLPRGKDAEKKNWMGAVPMW